MEKINNKTGKAKEFIVFLLVMGIFSLLVFKYYGSNISEKNTPRFVKVVYSQLEREALSIEQNKTNESASNVVVLTYHAITKGPPTDEYEISYEQFKSNMFELKREGYETVTLDDFNKFLNGEKKIPDKAVMLTFDDGAKSAFYNGDPILRALNYTAVMFLIGSHALQENNTKNVSVYYLNQTEVINMQNTSRWEFGSHTYESHFRLPINDKGDLAPALTNKLWLKDENRLESDQEFYNRISSDLNYSKFLMEKDFNKTVIAFALPYGDFGERGSNYEGAHQTVFDLTKSLFEMIFYEFPIKNKLYRANYVQSDQINHHLIVRIPADSLRDPKSLMERIDASRALNLPYHEDFNNTHRWIRISGEASFRDDSIIILNFTEPTTPDRALFSYLDGSRLWKDYTYSMQIANSDAQSVTLISRLDEDINFVGCKYDQGDVKIINGKNNVAKTVVSKPISQSFTEGSVLSMNVNVNEISCLLDGERIITEKSNDIPLSGGVGVRAENFRNEMTFSFTNVSIIGEN